MYDCKYSSFFLAKEISGYRDENTHIGSHTGEYSKIHVEECCAWRFKISKCFKTTKVRCTTLWEEEAR